MLRVIALGGIVLLLLGLIVAPHVVGRYHLEILTIMIIHIVLAQGYRLVAVTGDWSLGHYVLMGCGAYGAAMFAKFAGWPFWLSIPFGAIAAGVVGVIFVWPLLRTRAFGFFIGSYALGEFIRLVWIRFDQPFGGSRGIIGIPTEPTAGITWGMQVPYYYLTLGVSLVALVVLWRLARSRYGDVFEAIHEDEDLCESLGISVQIYRTWAFGLSAFFAGLAGALLAHKQMAIDPTLFDINAMVYLIIWVVVGGIRTFGGPIIGVVVMTLVFEATRFLGPWRPLLAGGILIVFLVLLPGGLEGLCRMGWAWVRERGGTPSGSDSGAAESAVPESTQS